MNSPWHGLKDRNLPYQGTFYLSKSKDRLTQDRPLIFFVHFYNGSQRQMLRHIRLVNEWGFDAFAFNLENHHSFMGVKHSYARQISRLIQLIPGEKILFTFSNPTASAIEAMVKLSENQQNGIRGFIADSGPTLQFKKSANRLLLTEYGIKNPWIRNIANLFFSFGWSPRLHQDLRWQLSQWPKHIPILSLQSTQDLLIPPSEIDEVFSLIKMPIYQKACFDVGHLLGLKEDKDNYIKALKPFLDSITGS